jgi:hypothetical protein
MPPSLDELVLIPKDHNCQVKISTIQAIQTSPNIQTKNINQLKNWQM